MNHSAHRGWHGRGYLPHFDGEQSEQFVTLRLNDSLPKAITEDLERSTAEVESLDCQLDRGFGACFLGRADVAGIVKAALEHFDGIRYRLIAWCIMPNHLHVLIETMPTHSLQSVVKIWKGYTAYRANRILNRSGTFWYPDYFDRFMRDSDHRAATIAYIDSNPVKAGLVLEPSQWKWSSAAKTAL